MHLVFKLTKAEWLFGQLESTSATVMLDWRDGDAFIYY